jgi:hypothetical protein
MTDTYMTDNYHDRQLSFRPKILMQISFNFIYLKTPI